MLRQNMMPSTQSAKAPVFSPSDLKALRKALGYSQTDFALVLSRAAGRKTPYSKGYIANMERGLESFPVTPKIAQAMRRLQRSRPANPAPRKPPRRLALTIDYTDDAQRQRHLALSMEDRRAALDAWLESEE